MIEMHETRCKDCELKAYKPITLSLIKAHMNGADPIGNDVVAIYPTRLARRFGFALLERGAESVNLTSFKYYDRMIPAQDALPEGGLGNLIALPMQGMALKNGKSDFIDENWNAYG